MNPAKRINRKIIVRMSGIVLAALVLYFLWRQFAVSWAEVRRDAVQISWGYFALAALIYAVAFLLTGWNWVLLQYRTAPGISRLQYLDIHVTSAFARYLPGGLWNIVGKAAWCIKLGASPEATGGGIVGEYLLQIMSSCLFLLLFFPSLYAYYPLLGIFLLLAGIAGAAGLPLWARWGYGILGKLFKSRVRPDLPARFLYPLFGSYLLAWVVTGISLTVLAEALPCESPIPRSLIFCYPVAWVVGFLSPSPNGLGVREWVLQLLLSPQLPEHTLLLLLIAARIVTIAGELIAFVGLKLFLWRRKCGW